MRGCWLLHGYALVDAEGKTFFLGNIYICLFFIVRFLLNFPWMPHVYNQKWPYCDFSNWETAVCAAPPRHCHCVYVVFWMLWVQQLSCMVQSLCPDLPQLCAHAVAAVISTSRLVCLQYAETKRGKVCRQKAAWVQLVHWWYLIQMLVLHGGSHVCLDAGVFILMAVL